MAISWPGFVPGIASVRSSHHLNPHTSHTMKYQAYTLGNLPSLPQYERLSPEQIRAIEVVANVLPFRVSSYVTDELIDWDHLDGDPMFNLTFPQRGMLLDPDYSAMDHALQSGTDRKGIQAVANGIRNQLNPHPAGQLEHNVPTIDGEPLHGVQHKYRETVLFFPSAGQNCHSYCTFCFRWPQFVGMKGMRFAMRESELLYRYIDSHPEITDLLFTGGDPMTMNCTVFRKYLEPLLSGPRHPHLQTIRIGTKSLAFWPYTFLTDDDADDFIRLFEEITSKGYNLSIMAHFSHPRELSTDAVRRAIARIRSTGAQIRTQSPLLRPINAKPEIWAEMWRTQVSLGCIPYYMFLARDTGAQHHFAVTLHESWEIWRKAYQGISGTCRTVRGPSMSCTPGKIQLLGVSEVAGQKVFVMRFLQGRNPDWVARPFFAKYNPDAIWISDLEPAFGDRFFFEEEDAATFHENYHQDDPESFE